MNEALPDLEKAIEWVATRWHERPVPIRLHMARTTDGTFHTSRDEDDPLRTVVTMGSRDEGELGGPPFSSAFARVLDATIGEKMVVELTEPCHHPRLGINVSFRKCPDCEGVLVKKARRERWRYPMWRAFKSLLNARNKMPRHPHPATLVMALAGARWDVPIAAHRIERPLEVAEALFLGAIRQLAGRYEEAPVPRRSKSESQQRAEAVA